MGHKGALDIEVDEEETREIKKGNYLAENESAGQESGAERMNYGDVLKMKEEVREGRVGIPGNGTSLGYDKVPEVGRSRQSLIEFGTVIVDVDFLQRRCRIGHIRNA